MAVLNTVAAPLDKSADFFADERYKALRLLWRRTSLKAVRSCQHHSVMPDGNVKVLITPTPQGPRVGFSGLATCGSVWACPVCSNKISARRSDEIARAIRKWESMGGRAALVTLTMRHNRGQRLLELWDAQSKAWTAVTVGTWADDQEKYGAPMPRKIERGSRKGEIVTENRIGWLRSVESTHGANGWHLHIHSILFLKGDPDLDGLAKAMFQRWRTRLVGLGLDAPLMWTKHRKDCEKGCSKVLHGGVDARWIPAGDGDFASEYVAKDTYDAALRAGFEVARGGQKRAGGRAPFQMLSSVCDNLDNADDPLLQLRAEEDLARWYEWEEASKGRRKITWSRGLRDFLALDDEMSDEDIADEDATTDETVVNANYVN